MFRFHGAQERNSKLTQSDRVFTLTHARKQCCLLCSEGQSTWPDCRAREGDLLALVATNCDDLDRRAPAFWSPLYMETWISVFWDTGRV